MKTKIFSKTQNITLPAIFYLYFTPLQYKHRFNSWKEIGLGSAWKIFDNIKKTHLAISWGNPSLRVPKIRTFETLCNEPLAQKPNLRI